VFRSFGFPVHPFASTHFWPVTAALALLITTTRAAWLRRAVLGWLIFGQLVWFGCLSFFGGVVKPEQLQLASHQLDEVWIGIVTGLRIMAPGAARGLLCGAAFFYLQE